ncbi:hypothetical protein [Paenibacillus xerothermodurans]|uniref:Uncharacterized protein n=1 Tax=Paenibacillus xerothermodurans TaxID=1977292 RepID=A0A2W1P526_PAEXE|nr:hypothetical protein [Paenibacillus xerothermodurans]PZE22268.1 hypothetical protein CBW46_000250 [Paenibacillus xerothermodurans]
MQFQTLVRSIDEDSITDVEVLIRKLRSELPQVYNAKSVEAFSDVFLYVLQIGVKLGYSPMMLYLPARPQVLPNLVEQFKKINMTIARREQHQDWFHDLFALFVGMASVLRLSWHDIERRIVEGKTDKLGDERR